MTLLKTPAVIGAAKHPMGCAVGCPGSSPGPLFFGAVSQRYVIYQRSQARFFPLTSMLRGSAAGVLAVSGARGNSCGSAKMRKAAISGADFHHQRRLLSGRGLRLSAAARPACWSPGTAGHPGEAWPGVPARPKRASRRRPLGLWSDSEATQKPLRTDSEPTQKPLRSGSQATQKS